VTSDNIKATELGDLSGFLGIWPSLAKEESKTRRKGKEMRMLEEKRLEEINIYHS
jgi:hypothetical protein